MSETPPAGWYPDPQDDSRQRYWDGNAWTEHTADGAGQATASASSSSASTSSASMSTGGSEPDTWTWQSIVVTILCCAPFGVAGALNAGRAEAALQAGDRAAADKYAGQAKKWTLWGLGVFALLVVGYVLFFVILLAGSGFEQGFSEI